MVNISDLIGTTSNWTAVSRVQHALFISSYCVGPLHQTTLFFRLQKKKNEKEKRKEGRKGSHEYNAALPYEMLQFCFEGEIIQDGI